MTTLERQVGALDHSRGAVPQPGSSPNERGASLGAAHSSDGTRTYQAGPVLGPALLDEEAQAAPDQSVPPAALQQQAVSDQLNGL